MIKKFLFQDLFKKFNNIALRLNLKPKNIDFSGKRCLCLAPHADDEAIGMGGVLNLYHNDFKVVLLTNGAKGIPDKSEAETIEIRAEEFKNAMKFAMISDFDALNIQDKGFSIYSDPKQLDYQIYLTPEDLNDLNDLNDFNNNEN